jgi:predicted NACHT family NTPase
MTQAPDPQKPPLSEQIADVVIKVIKPGGVTGGSLGAIWFLFVQSDIPKAIASAVIGVMLSYGAKLLQPIHRGNEQRFEKLGEAANRSIDRVGEAAIAKITSVEDRYLECQAADCETCSTEGIGKISGIFTPMLEQVFVPLELDRSTLLPGFGASESYDPADFTKVDIWALLARTKRDPIYSQIAILAWGGYGKTTLLRHVAYILGKNQQPKSVPRFIPVLLLLRKYRDLLTQDNPDDLATLIEQHHIPSLPAADGLRMPTEWARTTLKQGKMVVMLDGFDEVPKAQRPLVARWLNAQMRAYRKSVFILTSRPKAYTEQDPGDRLDYNTLLWVRKFKPKQRRDFIQKWYWCQEYYHHGKTDTPAVRKAATEAAEDLLGQIEAREELSDLTENPLLLNMIALFHRRYPSAELPKRRVELYQEMCVLQLRDRPGARKLETLLMDCEAQTILQMLALEMMQRKEERVDQETLLERLTHYLTSQEETVAAAEFLQQIEQISELIVQREPEEFEFAHLSFQEYLASREIVRLKQESLLYDHFGEDWWKSVTLLYAAQVKPSRLIRAAIDRSATDLAYACYQETTKRIDADLEAELSALKQTVQTSRYAKLGEYLKNGQWKEADEETYRLMITTVGKEEGQWFEPEELLNFPCEELLAIDGLWVKYSNGRFGFSVQKKIYLECGGIPDGQHYKEAFEKFGDRVGWRKNKKRVFNVMYSTSSPNGHLPVAWIGGMVFAVLKRAKVARILFSRIETCKP